VNGCARARGGNRHGSVTVDDYESSVVIVHP
jgi:hypothetical protein